MSSRTKPSDTGHAIGRLSDIAVITSIATLLNAIAAITLLIGLNTT